MPRLTWDNVGERYFETGVDRGVLYIPNQSGVYSNGVAWNGLTTITQTPTGAESNAQYADNIKYLNLVSAEEFTGTIEAFTYPDEFAQFDGLAVPTPGVTVGQQARRSFGLSYRTRIGNDIEGDSYAYKIHLHYGLQAAPSEKAYATVNDSPEAMAFSWSITSNPLAVDGMRPTASLSIESHKVDPTTLAALELMLYGDVAVNPTLPTPNAVINMFSSGVTSVTPTPPTFDGFDEITIPSIAGVEYFLNGHGAPLDPGALTIVEDVIIVARPAQGYVFTSGSDDDWAFQFNG